MIGVFADVELVVALLAVGADALGDDPVASAAAIPPACLDLPGTAPSRPRRARSVSDSTYQEPPAGSMTAAMWDSSMIRAWVLRATRRPSASGMPMAESNGSTVTASAPPTPAANAATVVRSMFT